VTSTSKCNRTVFDDGKDTSNALFSCANTRPMELKRSAKDTTNVGN
jgi:hypothetical protein